MKYQESLQTIQLILNIEKSLDEYHIANPGSNIDEKLALLQKIQTEVWRDLQHEFNEIENDKET